MTVRLIERWSHADANHNQPKAILKAGCNSKNCGRQVELCVLIETTRDLDPVNGGPWDAIETRWQYLCRECAAAIPEVALWLLEHGDVR